MVGSGEVGEGEIREVDQPMTGSVDHKSLQFYFECKMNKPKSASVHKFRSLVWLKI